MKYCPIFKYSALLYFSVRSTNIVRTIESAKCLVAGLFQQEQRGRALILTPDFSSFLLLSIRSVFVVFLALTDVVTILTEAAESEVLYPNYHGCKMLKILCGYVDKI